ncbi:hypothetical protein BRETT_005016 [Brettanomyces bruxellensis]|uniref:C2H2-type domain-containing protein n=1 Tax=Dekkera bruxellensis TaxID=5007 RepID=A0A871RE41_DEKBR|nr:uncharacterized protein BRETT_005016 [Brettanomyces bruxellensis]QOU20360.1 hypothetical protein BRETT_005016 [Brettanomyces bruxellensis]
MQILDSLKVDSADKLQDEEFIRGLDSAKVISKLLLSVYTLEGEVSKLKDQVGEYGRLNKLLDLEDVSSAETGKTKPEPTTVQGITLGEGGSSGVGSGNGSFAPNGRIPVGFTPMYGSPVISGDQVAPGDSEGEESDTGALQQRFVRPWPEVTLNQLASRFKIPRDLLSKTAKRLGASKELDDSNLKPIRAADIDGRARRGAVGRPRKHPGRPGRPHRGPGRPRKSRSRSPAVQPGRGDRSELRGVPGGEPRGVKREPGAPATADRAPDSKKSRLPSVSTLNYSVTRDLKYKCDSCGEIFHNYMQLYWHKRSEHPHELVGEAADASVASANGSISASFTPGAPFRSSSDASIDARPQPVSRGRPIGISIGGGSLTPYYSRSPDGSYSCSLCRRKPFTSYHGIYAHLRSVHYDAETDRYWKDGPRHSEAERGDESDRDEGVAASDGNIGNDGSTASEGNIGNDGSTTNDGNIENVRSVRNVGNIGNVRSVGNVGSTANEGGDGNSGSTANVEVEGTPNAGTANVGSDASTAVATTESTQGTGSNGNIGRAAITNGTVNDEIKGTTNTEIRDTTNTEVRDTTNTEVKGTEPPSQNEHHANSHTANIQVAVKHETVRDIPLEDIHTLNTHPGSHPPSHPSQNSNANSFSSFSGVLNPDTSKISQSAPQQTQNLPANTPHINNGSDSTSFPSSITATAVSDSLSSPPDATAVKSRLQSDLKDVFKA